MCSTSLKHICFQFSDLKKTSWKIVKKNIMALKKILVHITTKKITKTKKKKK